MDLLLFFPFGYATGGTDIAGYVKASSTHIEQAVDTEDDHDHVGGDTDGGQDHGEHDHTGAGSTCGTDGSKDRCDDDG